MLTPARLHGPLAPALGRSLLAAALMFPFVTLRSAAADESGAMACRTAGLQAERDLHLPPGLLLAIGQVESGRFDPATGRVAAWPWTINANGAGRTFEGKAEAVTSTRALQAGGVASIDVGCFQVNLFHHPRAFASVEEAFDPAANAVYAARFLSALHARTGSWEDAVAAYHSAEPVRGAAYRDRVLEGVVRASIPVPAPQGPPPPAIRMVVWAPSPGTGRVQVWTPSAPNRAAAIIVIRPAGYGMQASLPVVRNGAN
jgi:hypothetical protein